MNKYAKLAIAVVGCEMVGLVSSLFTMSSIPTWYAALEKPSFNPPNWIFGPVWTILYAMMGVAAYLVYQKGKKKEVRAALKVFAIQLVLNFFWSIIFFGLRQPLIALIEIVALWIFIVLTIRQFYAIYRPAAYLLIPYLLWVSFATILNGAIVMLN